MGNFCPPESGSGFWIRIEIHWPDRIRIRNTAANLQKVSQILPKHKISKLWERVTLKKREI
jgi:hypothetical protein